LQVTRRHRNVKIGPGSHVITTAVVTLFSRPLIIIIIIIIIMHTEVILTYKAL